VVSGALVGAVFCFIQRRKRKQQEDNGRDEIPLSTVPGSVSTNQDLQKRFEIAYSELTLEKEIGKGAFGVVFKAQWRNCDCVVKQLSLQTEEAHQEFIKEAQHVMRLKLHQNVCGVFGVCTDPNFPTSIVMEFVEGGSLKELVYDDKVNLDALTCVKLAKDVAGGMSHIHNEGILHCDLACRNLLYSERGNGRYLVKVTDLGLARIAEAGHYDAKESAKFPIRWTAPEVLTKRKLSQASDVWSFGVVLYEIMEGKLPYFNLENSEVAHFVCFGGRLEEPTRIRCPELWMIAIRCFQMEPRMRPSFQELFADLSKVEAKLTESRRSPTKSPIYGNANDEYVNAPREQKEVQGKNTDYVTAKHYK